jgi:hypothetical protein
MTPAPRRPVILRPARIDTVQDADRTLLVRVDGGQVFTLRGVDEAVWSWLTLGYSSARLVELLAALGDIPLERAADELGAILARWLASGILVKDADPHG